MASLTRRSGLTLAFVLVVIAGRASAQSSAFAPLPEEAAEATRAVRAAEIPRPDAERATDRAQSVPREAVRERVPTAVRGVNVRRDLSRLEQRQREGVHRAAESVRSARLTLRDGASSSGTTRRFGSRSIDEQIRAISNTAGMERAVRAEWSLDTPDAVRRPTVTPAEAKEGGTVVPAGEASAAAERSMPPTAATEAKRSVSRAVPRAALAHMAAQATSIDAKSASRALESQRDLARVFETRRLSRAGADVRTKTAPARRPSRAASAPRD